MPISNACKTQANDLALRRNIMKITTKIILSLTLSWGLAACGPATITKASATEQVSKSDQDAAERAAERAAYKRLHNGTYDNAPAEASPDGGTAQ